ncbi:MAG: nitrous oxide reductase family maturation protein NosD [Candidatus Odinarchaeota archaeon]
MLTRKCLIALLLIIMLSIVFPGSFLGKSATSRPFLTVDSTVLLDHEAIIIGSDAGFTNYSFPGEGTAANPYIIENINITAVTGPAISIAHTSLSFIIQNSYLNGETTGIKLENVSLGTARILNNTVEGCTDGIKLVNANSTIIRNNTVKNNLEDGIRVDNSSSVDVINNTVTFNMDGIRITNSESITVTNNAVANNNDDGMKIELSRACTVTGNLAKGNNDGIKIENCTKCLLSDNKIVGNNDKGLRFNFSRDNQVIYNLFQDNVKQGLRFYEYAPDNIIHHNAFFDNNEPSKQARDDSTGNTWYEVEITEGNYWNDLKGRKSYEIDGEAGVFDSYPLKTLPERVKILIEDSKILDGRAGGLPNIVVVSPLLLFISLLYIVYFRYVLVNFKKVDNKINGVYRSRELLLSIEETQKELEEIEMAVKKRFDRIKGRYALFEKFLKVIDEEGLWPIGILVIGYFALMVILSVILPIDIAMTILLVILSLAISSVIIYKIKPDFVYLADFNTPDRSILEIMADIINQMREDARMVSARVNFSPVGKGSMIKARTERKKRRKGIKELRTRFTGISVNLLLFTMDMRLINNSHLAIVLLDVYKHKIKRKVKLKHKRKYTKRTVLPEQETISDRKYVLSVTSRFNLLRPVSQPVEELQQSLYKAIISTAGTNSLLVDQQQDKIRIGSIGFTPDSCKVVLNMELSKKFVNNYKESTIPMMVREMYSIVYEEMMDKEIPVRIE